MGVLATIRKAPTAGSNPYRALAVGYEVVPPPPPLPATGAGAFGAWFAISAYGTAPDFSPAAAAAAPKENCRAPSVLHICTKVAMPARVPLASNRSSAAARG